MSVDMTEAGLMHNKNHTINHLKTDAGTHIAYSLSQGKLPGVMFLGGFNSDMTGSKALALETFCKERGQQFIRFDYQGHGSSSGIFKDGSIGQWKNDALAVLDELTEGPQLLVGSSMGGWISLLLARQRPERVQGLVGIAPAPDFPIRLIWEKFTPAQKQEIVEQGVYYAPSCYGQEPYPIMLNLIQESRFHKLLYRPIDVHCPVTLIHGQKDDDVPWQFSLLLKQYLMSKDVSVTLVKEGGHRMSEPENLHLLCQTVEEMLLKIT